jgi:hypothetical protein
MAFQAAEHTGTQEMMESRFYDIQVLTTSNQEVKTTVQALTPSNQELSPLYKSNQAEDHCKRADDSEPSAEDHRPISGWDM